MVARIRGAVPKRFGTYNEDYHLLQATKAEPLYRQFRNLLSAADIPIEVSKGEAAAGQHEINVHYAPALEAADRHALFKHGMKEIAWQNGYAITFMAKWTMAEAGSSCHMHSSVWNRDGTEPLMWEDDAPHHMSETFRYYMGGLMSTAREMAWMYAPFDSART